MCDASGTLKTLEVVRAWWYPEIAVVKQPRYLAREEKSNMIRVARFRLGNGG